MQHTCSHHKSDLCCVLTQSNFIWSKSLNTYDMLHIICRLEKTSNWIKSTIGKFLSLVKFFSVPFMPWITVSRFSFSSAPISSWFIPISTMPSRFNFGVFNFCVQFAFCLQQSVQKVRDKNWTLPKHNRNKIKVFIFKTFGELEIKIREYLSTNKTILTNWTWNKTSSDLYTWFNLFEFYKIIA